MTGFKPSVPNRSGVRHGGEHERVGVGPRAAGVADRTAVETLLEASALPVDAIGEGIDHFFVYEDGDGAILGVAGVELYGAAGLLRSVAVARSARRQGVAAALIQRAVAHAHDEGCRALYLLTLDAAPYFQRFGFGVIDRVEAPTEIRNSGEFAALCPRSAVLMRRRLGA